MRVLRILAGQLLREQAGALAFAVVLLSLLFSLGGYLFRTFGQMGMEAMGKISPELIAGMFGGVFGGLTPLETWLVTLFVHPMLLVVMSAIVIATASRAMAAEIDEGTVDLLLSAPVPRWTVVAAAFLVIQLEIGVLCVVLLGALRIGLAVGEIPLPDSWGALYWVTANVWALFFAGSGVALWISATVAERGKAIARSLAFLVVSFFLNLLASLWPRVEALATISVFNYHQPQPTVEAGGPLVPDFVVLLAVGGVATGAAFWRFVTRDIHVA